MSSAIAVVSSIVAGAGAALIATAGGAGQGAAITSGAIATAVLVVAHGVYQERRYSALTEVRDREGSRG